MMLQVLPPSDNVTPCDHRSDLVDHTFEDYPPGEGLRVAVLCDTTGNQPIYPLEVIIGRRRDSGKTPFVIRVKQGEILQYAWNLLSRNVVNRDRLIEGARLVAMREHGISKKVAMSLEVILVDAHKTPWKEVE